MKLPDRFKTLSDEERRKYSNKKKAEYEKKVKFWTRICQKLAANKDFTPLEMDEIDFRLEKEYPTIKDFSNAKLESKNSDLKIGKIF